MLKTLTHRQHHKRTQCLICKEFFLPQDTGYVKVIVGRLIDRDAIISGFFCSLECAKKFIEDEEKKKVPKINSLYEAPTT